MSFTRRNTRDKSMFFFFGRDGNNLSQILGSSCQKTKIQYLFNVAVRSLHLPGTTGALLQRGIRAHVRALKIYNCLAFLSWVSFSFSVLCSHYSSRLPQQLTAYCLGGFVVSKFLPDFLCWLYIITALHIWKTV